VRILFIGDIVGRPGRRALRELLPGFLEKYSPHAVIANCENAAGGRGLTQKVATELFSCGIDLITMGNHTWGNKEIFQFIDHERLVRPLNYPPGNPGRGWLRLDTKGGSLFVVNLLGRTNMAGPIDCPFQAMEEFLSQSPELPVVVDFHAETTSEKAALAWFLEGKVAAVVGTHTHVQTADARVLPGGTAFITDLGMTGPTDSILGVETRIIVDRFRTGLPQRFEVATGPSHLAGAFVELDPSGRAISIESFIEFLDREE
jgi:metallophosphoesterase (TIGR00282 family)